jgi:hypothetical protein
MKWVEKVTGAGRALWGYRDVDVAVSTIDRTWHSRHSGKMLVATSYRFGYQLLTPMKFPIEVREFTSEAARSEFIRVGITQWRERMTSDYVLRPWTPTFQRWSGAALEAIEIKNGGWLELRIGGEVERLEVLPELRHNGRSVAEGSDHYLEVIQSMVGRSISNVDVYLDDGLVIEAGGTELVVTTTRIWDDPWNFEFEWLLGSYVIPPQPSKPLVTVSDTD